MLYFRFHNVLPSIFFNHFINKPVVLLDKSVTLKQCLFNQKWRSWDFNFTSLGVPFTLSSNISIAVILSNQSHFQYYISIFFLPPPLFLSLPTNS